MPCKLRINYPGAIYRRMGCGDWLKKIYNDYHNWFRFPAALEPVPLLTNLIAAGCLPPSKSSPVQQRTRLDHLYIIGPM